MRLETERLLLRPPETADFVTLANLWSDAEVTQFMGGPRDYQSVLKSLQEDYEQNPPPEWNLWPVVEKATGNVIGHCGILDKEVEGRVEFEMVYVFTPSAWNKGYATEIASGLKDYAFEQLGLKRLIALISPLNTASSNVARKIGFHHEKDTVRPDGHRMQVYSLENQIK